ncbi:MAG TPA: rhodanese-like domain-containing protein [Thermodesulfovibrionales bacterium]|nr:rhodanese-like domain-containing protein [Thermodesulfovibrionales bacterium]
MKKTAEGMHRKLVVCSLFIGMFFVAVNCVYSAPYANPALLAEVSTVADTMGKADWVVVDCRDEKAYAAGHIPGAISLGGACGKVLRDPTFRVKKTEELEKMLGNAGLSMDAHVIFYADAKLITSASVAFWILEYLGHEKVHFLNGGIEAWEEAGKPLNRAEKKLPTATFKAKVMKERIATSEEMAKIGKGELKGTNVIDSRTENEHKGSDIRALRGGYIPHTTMNVSHVRTYDVDTGRIHTMEELENIFDKLDKGTRTIAYCQTGTRAALTYLELRLMGFKEPANYDDSWIVYGSNLNYPVANENWYDFVRVNDAIKAVDELKKAVEELRKR